MVLRRALLLAAARPRSAFLSHCGQGGSSPRSWPAVTPRDPAAFAAGAAVLIAVAGLAGYIPARRATLIEPAVALKQE